MSNFSCDDCKVDILEGPDGHYLTGCDHYPIEPFSLNQVRTQSTSMRELFGMFATQPIDIGGWDE